MMELQSFEMYENSIYPLPEGWEIVVATYFVDEHGSGYWKILCKKVSD